MGGNANRWRSHLTIDRVRVFPTRTDYLPRGRCVPPVCRASLDEMGTSKTPEPPGSDPYNRAGEPAPTDETAKLRSIDDFRRLKETVKNAPRSKQARKTAPEGLFEGPARMAMLRADLERVLREIGVLCAAGVAPGDIARANRIEQLHRAAYHLEEAINWLTPLEDDDDRAPPKGTR